MLTGRSIFTQKWRKSSVNGSCHVSKALKNQGSVTSSHNQPWRIWVNTSQHQMMIWFRNYGFGSGGYENIMTAMKVFARYLLVYPTSSQDRETVAKVVFNIMTKHTYLPTTNISDRWSVFIPQVIKEVAEVLGRTLQHATTKQMACFNERMPHTRKS